MPRPREVSDAEILAEARRCFLEFGPGVSTEVIAEGLGVSQPALFKRFGTKKALMIEALLPKGVPDWVIALDAGPDERPLVRQLAEMIQGAEAFFREVLPAMSVLQASKISKLELLAEFENGPPPLVARERLARWLERCLEAGLIRPVDPDVTSMMIMGAFAFRAFMSRMTAGAAPNPFLESHAEELADLLTRGLSPEEER